MDLGENVPGNQEDISPDIQTGKATYLAGQRQQSNSRKGPSSCHFIKSQRDSLTFNKD